MPDPGGDGHAGPVSVLGMLLGLAAAAPGCLQAAPETVPRALGEQRVAVLVAEVPGVRISPSVPELRDLFFSPTSPSVGSYLREVSHGKTWVTGDVFGPYALSRVYGWDNNEWNEALGAALKLAGGSIDLRHYDHLVLIFPAPGLGGWAGNAAHGCIIEGYCPAGGQVKVLFMGRPPRPRRGTRSTRWFSTSSCTTWGRDTLLR